MVARLVDVFAGSELPRWSVRWSGRLAMVGFVGACVSQLVAFAKGIDTWDYGIVALVWPFFYAVVLLCGRGMVWQGRSPLFQRVFGTELTAYSRFLGVIVVLLFPAMATVFGVGSIAALTLGW